ncbi:hypothetical protein ACFPRL_00920 [Pseudoclavibacter helvolus]
MARTMATMAAITGALMPQPYWVEDRPDWVGPPSTAGSGRRERGPCIHESGCTAPEGCPRDQRDSA